MRSGAWGLRLWRFGLVALVTVAVWAALTPASLGQAAGRNNQSVTVSIGDTVVTGKKVYPTGTAITVLTGNIKHGGTPSSEPPVKITGGSVTNITSNNAACTTFINSIVGGIPGIKGLVTVTNPAAIPPGHKGGGWAVSLTMRPNAPDLCQSKVLSYTVTITVGDGGGGHGGSGGE